MVSDYRHARTLKRCESMRDLGQRLYYVAGGVCVTVSG